MAARLRHFARALWEIGRFDLWDPGTLPTWLGRLAAGLGLIATGRYALTNLTLAHYDAKAHLVVARRIFDSLTPGWEQIGAVWLPLPHLINALPVQVDHLYRTGGFAIAISVLSHALASASIAGTILTLTNSRAGAILGAALYATNPNVLYLQSTPMTEPMLFGLTALQVFLLARWVVGGNLAFPPGVGIVTALACLTRYEAWPITAAALAASAYAWWRRGRPLAGVLRVHARLAAYPVITVLAFMVFSRVTVGEWFTSGGFFVPDDTIRGQPAVIADKIAEGLAILAGERLLWIARIAFVIVAVAGVISARLSPVLIATALVAAIAVPASAYYSGHPFRIRYEIPLVVAAALVTGVAVGMTRMAAWLAALVIFVVVIVERPPFDRGAPMIAEAQLDSNVRERREVTRCLRDRYDGSTIMASMGALGHYMHELSAAGFRIRDFLHEGNGPIWDSAFTRGPAPLAGWVLVEEVAEGGDAIIQRHRQYPRLLESYEVVCRGGNVTVYRRRVQSSKFKVQN